MKMTFPRDFYLPKNEATLQTITRDGINAVVYTYESSRGTAFAIGFAGKAQKPSFNYSYRNAERRAEHIDGFFSNLAASARMKAERAAARKAYSHTLKVGSLLSTSWGYEQTNVDFYQVVAVVSDKTVKIRKIAGEEVEGSTVSHGMACKVRAAAGNFVSDEIITVRVGRGNSVKIDGHYGSETTATESHYCSWYA